MVEPPEEITVIMLRIARQKNFFPANTVIGNLCQGLKAMTKVMEDQMYKVIGKDKYVFCESWESFDIYVDQFPAEINLIVTHPPSDEPERLLEVLFRKGNKNIFPPASI